MAEPDSNAAVSHLSLTPAPAGRWAEIRITVPTLVSSDLKPGECCDLLKAVPLACRVPKADCEVPVFYSTYILSRDTDFVSCFRDLRNPLQL